MILPNFIAIIRLFVQSNYIVNNQDRCVFMSGNTPLDVRQQCSSIFGYLPSYQETVMPQKEGKLHDYLILRDISKIQDSVDPAAENITLKLDELKTRLGVLRLIFSTFLELSGNFQVYG